MIEFKPLDPTNPDYQKWIHDPAILSKRVDDDSSSSQPAFYFGVWRNGRLAGWTEVFDIHDYSGEIGLVLPECKGSAYFIAKKFIKMLFDNGFRELRCKILVSNTIVVQGAKLCGFSDEKHFYDRKNQPCVLMTLKRK